MNKMLATLISGALMAGIAIQGLASKSVYADNLVLTGDTAGLRVAPENEDLFNIDAMLPGESAVSSIQISNMDNYAFTLSVEVKNMKTAEEDGAELLDVLKIKVLRDNTEIADFPVTEGSYSLGRFAPGATVTLDIAIGLDEREASNAYQAKSLRLQWIFTAVSDYTEGGGGYISDSGSRESGITATRSSFSNPSITPVIIEDDEVPLGIPSNLIETPDEDDPADDDEWTELLDEETPRGAKEMPKTGEISLLYYIAAGIVISGLGVVILLKMRGE